MFRPMCEMQQRRMCRSSGETEAWMIWMAGQSSLLPGLRSCAAHPWGKWMLTSSVFNATERPSMSGMHWQVGGQDGGELADQARSDLDAGCQPGRVRLSIGLSRSIPPGGRSAPGSYGERI